LAEGNVECFIDLNHYEGKITKFLFAKSVRIMADTDYVM